MLGRCGRRLRRAGPRGTVADEFGVLDGDRCAESQFEPVRIGVPLVHAVEDFGPRRTEDEQFGFADGWRLRCVDRFWIRYAWRWEGRLRGGTAESQQRGGSPSRTEPSISHARVEFGGVAAR